VDEIYVQIPAYRDSELGATLIDLYAKAEAPKRLRTRVLWQHARGETLPPEVRQLPNLEIVAVPCEQSLGCNWARNQLQAEWKGEPFTLFLDSHHRFVRHWDTFLKAMYRGLEDTGAKKPMLTSYLPAYDPNREPGGRGKRPYRIYPLRRDAGILVRLTSYPIPFWTGLNCPVEADFLSLHFIFAAGALNEDLRFDPAIYFFGDEVVTSARAFTHGYNFFHPHRIIGWHAYDRASRVPHWDDHADWHERHSRALALMRRLLTGTYKGPYGLGKERSLAEYEDRILMHLCEPCDEAA
jgi:hypothetical protein